LKKLKNGKTSPVVFTIIEGQTFTEIKNKIAESTFVKNGQFDIANTLKLSKALNIENHQNLEGLFYPDTYFFDYSVTGFQILKFAHEKQKEVLNSLWEKKAQKEVSYKEKYESLILGSIIEKETMLNAEKKIVSSVFHNRLKIRMKLQADPTVIYGLREKFTGNLKKRHLKEDNEYNTYTRYGLPPTPICSVSKSSLEAAINPSQTKFLYFVANKRGEHIFATTLKEHNLNVFKYQKNK